MKRLGAKATVLEVILPYGLFDHPFDFTYRPFPSVPLTYHADIEQRGMTRFVYLPWCTFSIAWSTKDRGPMDDRLNSILTR